MSKGLKKKGGKEFVSVYKRLRPKAHWGLALYRINRVNVNKGFDKVRDTKSATGALWDFLPCTLTAFVLSTGTCKIDYKALRAAVSDCCTCGLSASRKCVKSDL